MMLTFNHLKTFYNALKEKLKKHRGNWLQNDPTADDYIKNRPFYEELKDVILVDNFTGNDDERPSCNFVEGQAYTVILNGVRYDNIICVLDGSYRVLQKEGLFYIDDNGGDGFYYDIDNLNSITIRTVETNIYKLDKKYLPDNLVSESDLSTVAKTGSYNDLIDKPNIPQNAVLFSNQTLTDAQKAQARLNIGAGTSNFSGSYSDLKDKPAIPTVPTNVSAFTNDAGYLTEQIQSDWNQTDETQADYIKNKPALTSEYIILVDQINGYEYIVQMHNGNLISFCRCASIEVTTPPDIVEYFKGETIDLTGMTVSAICQDGSYKEISNYTYSPTVMTEDTDHIEVVYEECDNTYTTTIEISLKSIEDQLGDFGYTANANGTYTLTSWNETLNGEPSTKLIVPDIDKIIV